VTRRFVCVGLLALCLAVVPVWSLAAPPAQEQVSDNLLVDGGFEAPAPWPWQDDISEVQVAPGWRAWYVDVDKTPPYVARPSNCSDTNQKHCYWMRPEFRDNFAESFANRVRSGERSQKYFSYGRMHEAGLLQQVKGIPPGARVRFSIWIQAWMCFDSAHCGKVGEKSDQPSDMHLRVGIDPLGGTDPFTPTMVWSLEQPAWDKFTLFQIETVALTDTVTVFTHSRPEWDWARGNNDVYLDDASLVIVGAYTTPGEPGSHATAALTGTMRTPTPVPTATPLPPGAITHTLQMGDTLFDVALRYGLRVSDLLQLNRITTQTQLYLAQPLVIRIETLTPTPLSSPTLPPPSETPTPRPSETPQPTGTPVPVVATLVPPTPQPLPSMLPIIVISAAGLSVVVVLIILVVRAARS